MLSNMRANRKRATVRQFFEHEGTFILEQQVQWLDSSAMRRIYNLQYFVLQAIHFCSSSSALKLKYLSAFTLCFLSRKCVFKLTAESQPLTLRFHGDVPFSPLAVFVSVLNHNLKRQLCTKTAKNM